MKIAGRRSVVRIGPLRINRTGLTRITSVTVPIWHWSWTVWKRDRRRTARRPGV